MPLLPGIDDFAVIERFIFFRKLRFGRQLGKDAQHFVVNGFRRIIVGKPGRHRHTVLRDALRAVLSRHLFF